MKKKIHKLLIANRGEIALRLIRACKELGIISVVVHSEADKDGVWVKKADQSIEMKGHPVQVYLDYENIIVVAKQHRCDAVHPGYGFLSENAEFAKACEKNGLTFVGPKAEHIALFGDKIASKEKMKEIGVPVIEGTTTPVYDVQEAMEVAQRIGYPVIIKAAYGGGGRGMRIVESEEGFASAFENARAEAEKYFGNGDLFVEKYIRNPRHIEVQIIADKYGNVVHLGERDCSIQRRHQKVIEISPSPRLNQETRKELFRIAQKAIYKLGYESVGTIEFLVDEDDEIYFIEMNTRIQVEHPVTEITTGVDLIQRMIQIAEGDKLQFLQEEISFRGYAIEFRINAEDPQKEFMPSFGTIGEYLTPGGPGVRLDSGIYSGYTIPPHYDSMVAKLIVWALDWEGVIKKAQRALDEYYIDGIKTNIALHKAVLGNEEFQKGCFTTNFLNTMTEDFALLNTIAPTQDNNISSFMARMIQKGILSIKGDFL
ncbi:acetyl-CoA carboxylase biotin carboxylase subunit [Sulfurovum sp. ST-21]|uniref:Acetyl-CoA carboxylase biotin carboxylase subunit n=1 Tax=Sulfurovum indicum TaxID=2779528 RepID=A0A7M1S1L8_9BACT|nr:acetyl-CoA carboxylase biotin carboxylase subunit [Sulfurovum indicum]QOR61278.1 acetyl-CoA carboxylase biotin carboxylase subunit [Sulfurovum indicum]